MNIPKIWSLWQHKNGIIYRVINLANMASTNEHYPKTVVYENVQTGSVWSRPLDSWHRSFTHIEQ